MEHTVTDRGFKHMEPVDAEDGHVRVYESSNAEGPHLWLSVTATGGVERATTAVELTLEQAAHLADQLAWLYARHYQNEGTDG